LAPPVGPGAGVIMREVVPGGAVLAVVLPNRPPRPLGEVGPPRPPRLPPGVGGGQPLLLCIPMDHSGIVSCRRPRRPGTPPPSPAELGQSAWYRAGGPGSAMIGSVIPISFGPQLTGDLAAGSAREWLVADGRGGYAMGTVTGLRTRRYHGLLVVAGD